jgi:hypothetical protein
MILEDAAVAFLTLTLCAGTFTFVSPIKRYVDGTRTMLGKDFEDPVLGIMHKDSKMLDIEADHGRIDIDGTELEQTDITTDRGVIRKNKHKKIDIDNAPEVFADTLPLQEHIKELIEDHPAKKEEQQSSSRQHMDDLLQRIEDHRTKQSDSSP